MNPLFEDLLKLLAALILGGIVGAERERHKKAVGLRTLILISVGSALFTILSIRIVGPQRTGSWPHRSQRCQRHWLPGCRGDPRGTRPRGRLDHSRNHLGGSRNGYGRRGW